MLHRNMFNKYYAEASPDGSAEGEGQGGADAGGQPEVTIESLTAKLATYAGLEESNAKMQAQMNTLLGETKAAKDAKRLLEEQTAQAANEAKLNEAKSTQSLETFEAELREQLGNSNNKTIAEKDGEIERLNNMLLGGKKNEAVARLSAKFETPEIANLILGNLIDSKHGENNSIVQSFKNLNGEMITTDIAEFEKYLSSAEAFAPYLKGVNSSGGQSDTKATTTGAGGGQSKLTREQWDVLPIAEKPARAKDIIQ